MSDKRMRVEILLQAIDKATKPMRQLMGNSRGASKELQALRDRFKELDRAQAQINEFRNVSRGAAVTSNQLKAAQERVRALKTAMAEVPAPTRDMVRSLKEAQKEAAALKTRHTKLIEQQQRLRNSMREAGINTRQLGQHQREIKGQLQATTEAMKAQEARLKRLNQVLAKQHAAKANYEKGMGKRDALLNVSGTLAGAGSASAAAVSAPVIAYAQAEDSATQLKVAMMGAGGVVQREFAAVNALAEKLGNQLPGTTSEFQDMMRVLIQKGLDAKVVLGGAGEATAKLAVLTKIGFEQSAEAISVFQDSMGVADKDMVSAADQMQRLYNVGMKIPDIQEGFKAMGPALSYVRKNGIDAVKALGPLLAITDAAGMDAGSAGNAYNKIIRGSVDKKKVAKANEELKGTDIKLNFVDAKGNFDGVDNMVNQILKIQRLSDQKRKTVIETVFGSDKEVAEALNALGKAGNPGIEAMRKKLANQASLQERVNAQLGTLKNLWDAATGTFTNTLVKFGEAIAPEVKAVTVWLGDLAEKLGEWAKENPKLANTLMKLTAGVAVVLTVLGALTLALATLLGPMLTTRYGLAMLGIKLGSLLPSLGALSSGFGMLMRGMMLLGGGFMRLPGLLRIVFMMMLANPVVAIVAMLAAAAVYIWANWGSLGPKFAALWFGIKSAAGTAGDWIMQKWNGITGWFSGLSTRFVAIGGQIIDGLMSGIDAKWEALKSKAQALADTVTNTVKGALGIHSPSRVFAGLGGFTMVGFAQGLTDAQHAPLAAVLSTVQKLTVAGAGLALGAQVATAAHLPPLDTRPPVYAAGTAMQQQSATGSTIIVNVYPSVGMDEKALADLVRKELQLAQRQQNSPRRGALYDQE